MKVKFLSTYSYLRRSFVTIRVLCLSDGELPNVGTSHLIVWRSVTCTALSLVSSFFGGVFLGCTRFGFIFNVAFRANVNARSLSSFATCMFSKFYTGNSSSKWVVSLQSVGSPDIASAAWFLTSARWTISSSSLHNIRRHLASLLDASNRLHLTKSCLALILNRVQARFGLRTRIAHTMARNSHCVVSYTCMKFVSTRDQFLNSFVTLSGCSWKNTHPTCTSQSFVLVSFAPRGTVARIPTKKLTFIGDFSSLRAFSRLFSN